MDKNETKLLSRIEVNPQVLAGKPIIRGYRISVEQVLKSLAAGISYSDLLDNFPELEKEDIWACQLYAAKLVEEEIELNTEITTLINFNYELIKPIPVKLLINDGEVTGSIKELDIYSFANTEFEVLREINEDETELFEELLSLNSEQFGKKPKKWKKKLREYIK